MQYLGVLLAIFAAVAVLIALIVTQRKLQRALLEAAKKQRRDAIAARRAQASAPVPAPSPRPPAAAPDNTSDESADSASESKVRLPPTSLVLLLREPAYFSEDQVASAIRKAWHTEPTHDDKDECAFLPEHSDSFRALQFRGSMFVIVSVHEPYRYDRDWYIQDETDPDLLSAWQKHRAWVALDLAFENPDADHADNEILLAKLAAELAPQSALAILRPAVRHAAIFDPETRTMLRRMPPWDVIKGPIRSLVIMQRRFEDLSPASLASAIHRALGTQLPSEPDYREGDFATLTPDGEAMIQFQGFRLGILNRERPYVENLEDAAQEIEDLRLRHAMRDHKTWMAVDMFEAPVGMPKTRVYELLGRIAAELIDDRTLVLYCPELQRGVTPTASLLDDLRSPDPLKAMFNPQPAILEVHNDDPKMQAAISEARRRLPEFIAAFHLRLPDQHFAIKTRFTDGESIEFMWVAITSVDGDTLVGTLENEPLNVRNVHLGDTVRTHGDDVIDWFYPVNDSIEGNFTMPVIMAAQKNREA